MSQRNFGIHDEPDSLDEADSVKECDALTDLIKAFLFMAMFILATLAVAYA